MIFEKKIVSTACQTRLNIFFAQLLLVHGQEKAKLKIMPLEWSRYLIYFFLSCTQHLENRKNRKPRKSALKFSIGISALGLSAHICPTCRYVRPCFSLNTSNWPLKHCGYILKYIYGWFMEKIFFRFFGPYKAGPFFKGTFTF